MLIEETTRRESKLKNKKSKLETLTSKQIDHITELVDKRTDVPLVSSKQINMRVSSDLLERIKLLASAQGVPFTTFLSRLLKEDIERLWSVYKKAD
jgi:predicted DNA binding CopG/RHH family protein